MVIWEAWPKDVFATFEILLMIFKRKLERWIRLLKGKKTHCILSATTVDLDRKLNYVHNYYRHPLELNVFWVQKSLCQKRLLSLVLLFEHALKANTWANMDERYLLFVNLSNMCQKQTRGSFRDTIYFLETISDFIEIFGVSPLAYLKE